jgi:regulator of RNase E activity RraA
MNSTSVPPTSALADVLLILGRKGVLSPPLHHAAGSSVALHGPARTIAFEPTPSGDGGTFDDLYALLDSHLEGQVLVIAGAEAVNGAVWGQILNRAAARAGALAVLVAGAIRDVAELRDSHVSVWALTEHTMGATGNARVAAVDVPVRIGDVLVNVGDPVVVDPGGAVRLPKEQAAALFEHGREYAEAERRLLVDLDAGVSLVDAYEHKRTARRHIVES